MTNKDLYELLKNSLQKEDQVSVYFDELGFVLSCIQIRWKTDNGRIQNAIFVGTDNEGVSFRFMCMCSNGQSKFYRSFKTLLKVIGGYKTHCCQK